MAVRSRPVVDRFWRIMPQGAEFKNTSFSLFERPAPAGEPLAAAYARGSSSERDLSRRGAGNLWST